MRFTSGGYARKNGFVFEIKYSGYLDGVHQENPWYLYVSHRDKKNDTMLSTYTERSMRFASREDAEAFCEHIANGVVTLSALREGELSAWEQHQAQQTALAKAELTQYLARLSALGVEPAAAIEVLRLLNGLSAQARALALTKEDLPPVLPSEELPQNKESGQTLGAWLSGYKHNVDICLTDLDGTDHFLPTLCYLAPDAIAPGGIDYTAREKWLLSLPLSHIAEDEGCMVAVVNTGLTYEQTDFLLGVPQFDSPDWREISIRAVYAGADFEERLNYLRDGTSFETPFNGDCMDAFDTDKQPELCQLLSKHPQVFVTLFPGSKDTYYAYAIEKGQNGQAITSELAVPIRYTEPGKGLTSTLMGKIAWAQHTGLRPAFAIPSQPPLRPQQKEV